VVVRLRAISREVEVGVSPISLNYVDVGVPSSDSVVVLVHGLGGRWQHWSRVIGAISVSRRVIALDLPGFGESSPLRERVELAGFADAVAGLLRELAIERIVFVGRGSPSTCLSP
jgi:pimeloyl-ACP methyl ester carboxylesterase